MINIITPSRYKLDRRKINSTINQYLTKYSFLETDVLNVIFVGRNKMREIAKKYKKEDEALPVLSFSYINSQDKPADNEKLVGEVFVCYPQAILLAAEREKGAEDTIISLIEHGIENIASG